jgi:hypothetical protein
MLSMRKLLANDDQAFKELITDIEQIVAMVHKDGLGYDIDKIELKAFDFSAFGWFIQFEAFDNPHILRYFINHVINDLYDDHNHNILKIDCQQLRNRHFDGQSFNSNPLLKLMLISFTPREISKQIKKECFPEENLNFLIDNDFISDVKEIYSNNYGSKKIHWIGSIGRRYTSSAMIKFLKNNLEFLIHGSSDLVCFIRRLDRLKLLFPHDYQEKKDSSRISLLSKLIKFKFKSETGNIWKWDYDTFNEYLKQRISLDTSRGDDNISLYEYEKYMNLVEYSNN